MFKEGFKRADLTCFVMAGVFAFASLNAAAFADIGANVMPNLNQAVNGNVTSTPNPDGMQWNNFNPNPSFIYGKMTMSSLNGCPSCTSTGKVILINPEGTIFGNGSKLEVNSLDRVNNVAQFKDAFTEGALKSNGKTQNISYSKNIQLSTDGLKNGSGYIDIAQNKALQQKNAKLVTRDGFNFYNAQDTAKSKQPAPKRVKNKK